MDFVGEWISYAIGGGEDNEGEQVCLPRTTSRRPQGLCWVDGEHRRDSDGYIRLQEGFLRNLGSLSHSSSRSPFSEATMPAGEVAEKSRSTFRADNPASPKKAEARPQRKPRKNKPLLVHSKSIRYTQVEKVYNRWIRLGVFFLVMAVNNMLWMSFSSIKPAVEETYGLSDRQVYCFSLIFMIAYPIGAYASLWTLHLNTTIPVLICSGLGAVGGITRCFTFTSDSYWLLYLGQIFPALGQPFALCLPPKLAGRWFKASERELACTIGCLAAPFGIIMAFVLTPALDLPNLIDFTGSNLFIEAMIAIFVFGLSALIYRDPEHHDHVNVVHHHHDDGYTALANVPLPNLGLPSLPQNIGPLRTWDGLRYVVNSPSILHLIFMFGVSQGSFLTICTLIHDLLPGFSTTTRSLFVALSVLGGFFGSGLNAVLLRRTKAFKTLMVSSLLAAIGVISGIIFTLPYHIVMINATASFLLGLFVFPNIMLAYELSVEMTFLRVDESLVGGLCQVWAQVVALGQVLIITPMLENHDIVSAWGIILVSFVIAALATFFIKVKTLRHDAELSAVMF